MRKPLRLDTPRCGIRYSAASLQGREEWRCTSGK